MSNVQNNEINFFSLFFRRIVKKNKNYVNENIFKEKIKELIGVALLAAKFEPTYLAN